MDDGKSIERFLNTNSSIHTSPVALGTNRATLKTKYRPDKIYNRDPYMKWDMVFNGIDTPHRMANNSVHILVDRTWLKTELNEIDDFKI